VRTSSSVSVTRTMLDDRSVSQRRLPRSLRWLEGLAARPLGALVLFVLALAVYAIRAVAWPLSTGRDLDDYLRYYLQILDAETLLPAAMLFRAPVVPIVTGLALDVAGGALAEPIMAVLYAASIVGWSAAALAFGPRVALVTAAALLVYPGYGAMFHELASEPVFATTLAWWAFLVTRAAARPSLGRFAAVGAGVALLALVRPANQVLVVFAVFPLFLSGAWRERLLRAGTLLGAAVVPLAAYALYNGLRYGEYTVARGGETALPFYRAFVTDRIVSPGNGDASRRLADAVRRDLVTRQPYTGYGVTLGEVFSSGSGRIHEDLVVLSDRVFGWDSNYATLRDAGVEAVLERPGAYGSGVLRTIWTELWDPFYRVVSSDTTSSGDRSPRADTVVVDGRRLPRPSEGQPIPPGQSFWVSRPDGAIREVWTSPTRHVYTFVRPEDRPRFERIQASLGRLLENLPDRSGSSWLATWINRASRWYPRPALWLAVGLVALVWRRPNGSRTLVALAASALLLVAFTALGLPGDLHYVLPVAPAFVLFGLGALLGDRRRRASSPQEHDGPGERGQGEGERDEQPEEGGLGGVDSDRIEERHIRDLANPEAPDRDR
jgi:Dolichyl-phosphate-mannose-protein mannosyltransferase